MLNDLWLPIKMPLLGNKRSVSVAQSSEGKATRTGGEPRDQAGDASDQPTAVV